MKQRPVSLFSLVGRTIEELVVENHDDLEKFPSDAEMSSVDYIGLRLSGNGHISFKATTHNDIPVIDHFYDVIKNRHEHDRDNLFALLGRDTLTELDKIDEAVKAQSIDPVVKAEKALLLNLLNKYGDIRQPRQSPFHTD